MTQKNLNALDTSSIDLLAGYVIIPGPNGHPAVLPEFMIPASSTAFDGLQYKAEINFNEADGGV